MAFQDFVTFIFSNFLSFVMKSEEGLIFSQSVGLLLVVLQRQKEVEHTLLTPLMKLGLPTVLINLLAFEMRKLTNERKAERYNSILSASKGLELDVSLIKH